MSRMSVGEVWGIGRRIAERLVRMGISTVLQLKQADPKAIKRQFSVVVERTIAELNGISCLVLEDVAPDKQQIIASRSFADLVTDFDTLVSSITHHVSRAAEKLRLQYSAACLVGVSIRTNPFREQDPQYHGWTVVPLVPPSTDTLEITRAALAGLHAIYREGFSYKKAGVMLMQISPSGIDQQDLFAPLPDPRRTALMATLDQVNRAFGHGTLRLASEGLTQHWAIWQEKRSPRWTTCWDELPLAH